MTYRYRPGMGRSDVAAGVVGEAITELDRRDGFCSAEALVEHAKPKRSKLHPLFEWDDEVAGQKWRVSQARRLIRSIEVVVDGGGGSSEPVTVSAFVHANPKGEHETSGYVPVSRAAADAVMAEQVKRETLAMIAGLRRRLVALGQFPALAAELGAVLEVEAAA